MAITIRFGAEEQEAARKLLALSMRPADYEARMRLRFEEANEGILAREDMERAWRSHLELNSAFSRGDTFEGWAKSLGRSMEEFLYASQHLAQGDRPASEDEVRSAGRNLNLLVHCLEEIRDHGAVAFETRAEATIFEEADAVLQHIRRMHGNAHSNRTYELDEGVAERLRREVLGQDNANDDELTPEETIALQKELRKWRAEAFKAEQDFGTASYPGGNILSNLHKLRPDHDPIAHQEAGADAEDLYKQRWNILRELGQRFTGQMDEFVEIRKGDGFGLSSRIRNLSGFLAHFDPEQSGTSPTVQSVVHVRKAQEYMDGLSKIKNAIDTAKPPPPSGVD